jgi:hypothetical protein
MKRFILALLTGAAFAASSPAYAAVKTIVLVHGAFADGSGSGTLAPDRTDITMCAAS